MTIGILLIILGLSFVVVSLLKKQQQEESESITKGIEWEEANKRLDSPHEYQAVFDSVFDELNDRGKPYYVGLEIYNNGFNIVEMTKLEKPTVIWRHVYYPFVFSKDGLTKKFNEYKKLIVKDLCTHAGRDIQRSFRQPDERLAEQIRRFNP